jgi:MFS family permease
VIGEALAPLRTPAFANLAFAYLVNELGNWLGEIALAVLVFDATGSTIATAGLFLAMQALPALAAPVLVARIERIGVGSTLPCLYLGEAIAFAVLAAVSRDVSLGAVLSIAAADGLLGASARALTRGTVADLLGPRGVLREGNAILNMAFTTAAAVGPALAGAVVAGVGPRSALLADAGSFAGAAALVAIARGLPAGRRRRPGERGGIREALAHVGARPRLRVLMAAQGAALVFFALVIPIEVAFAKQTLDAGNFGYGALLASWGAGMVAGGLAFAGLRRHSLALLLGAGTLAIAAAYLVTAIAPTLAVACLASVVGGAGNGVQFIGVVTAVQELTGDGFQARVASLLDAITRAAPGLGFAIGGAVAALASPRASYAAAGFGVLAVLAVAAVRLRAVGWRGCAPSRPSLPGPEGPGPDVDRRPA